MEFAISASGKKNFPRIYPMTTLNLLSMILCLHLAQFVTIAEFYFQINLFLALPFENLTAIYKD